MIDTSKKYWTGDCAADIDEWLRLYVPNEALDIKPVACRACGGDGFLLRLDRDEGVIQVECTACGAKKYCWTARTTGRTRGCGCASARCAKAAGSTTCGWALPAGKTAV